MSQLAANKKFTIEATRIFYANMEAKAKVIINRGGARSSKSYSILQLLLLKLLQEQNKQILILRRSLPSLRISTLVTFKQIIETMGVMPYLTEEKVNLNFRYKDGVVHFGSLDDPEKIKSSEWNYILMEEATEFNFQDYQTLRLRLSAKSSDRLPNQMFLSLNPVDQNHWIKKRLIDAPQPDIVEISSTYKDNPYLTQDYIDVIEGLIEQDPNYHRIYAKGEWGALDHLIYTNWYVTDVWPVDFDEVFYGVDFGYNNPTAVIQIGMLDGEIYERELVYSSGLTNADLIVKLDELQIGQDPVYCDNAEPQRAEEIYRAGYNVHPADKSVKTGIDFVKQRKVYIHKDSLNLIKEKQGYSWRTNRDGVVLDEPIKFNDHILDAERYALYTHLKDRSCYDNDMMALFGDKLVTMESYID